MLNVRTLTNEIIRAELRRAISVADGAMELLCNTALGYPTTSGLARQRICDAINARAKEAP